MDTIGLYISFRLEKGVNWDAIKRFFTAANRVLDYLSRDTAAIPQALGFWVTNLKSWLERVASQSKETLLTKEADQRDGFWSS